MALGLYTQLSHGFTLPFPLDPRPRRDRAIAPPPTPRSGNLNRSRGAGPTQVPMLNGGFVPRQGGVPGVLDPGVLSHADSHEAYRTYVGAPAATAEPQERTIAACPRGASLPESDQLCGLPVSGGGSPDRHFDSLDSKPQRIWIPTPLASPP